METILQLDDPVSATQVPDKDVAARIEAKALEAAATTYPTVWGATSTTTVSTTAMAEIGDVVFLRFPKLTEPQQFEYTTRPVPTNPNSKQYPDGQPILVLTQVEGAIMNSQSSILTTATAVQAPPPGFSSSQDSNKLSLMEPAFKWSTWSSAEKGGIIAAAVLAVLVILGFTVYVYFFGRNSDRKADVEKGPEDRHERDPSKWFARRRKGSEVPREKNRKPFSGGWRTRGTQAKQTSNGDESRETSAEEGNARQALGSYTDEATKKNETAPVASPSNGISDAMAAQHGRGDQKGPDLSGVPPTDAQIQGKAAMNSKHS
ncbi:MAG: hypothetical protein M1837_006196 [Sclerophora amabilis]|nr:MAG: hypothetical protein M1837_006196 [Sclerophora amabilis]